MMGKGVFCRPWRDHTDYGGIMMAKEDHANIGGFTMEGGSC